MSAVTELGTLMARVAELKKRKLWQLRDARCCSLSRVLVVGCALINQPRFEIDGTSSSSLALTYVEYSSHIGSMYVLVMMKNKMHMQIDGCERELDATGSCKDCLAKVADVLALFPNVVCY